MYKEKKKQNKTKNRLLYLENPSYEIVLLLAWLYIYFSVGISFPFCHTRVVFTHPKKKKIPYAIIKRWDFMCMLVVRVVLMWRVCVPKKLPLKTPVEGNTSAAAALGEGGRRRSSLVLYICWGEREEEHNSSPTLFKVSERIELNVLSEATLVQTLQDI